MDMEIGRMVVAVVENNFFSAHLHFPEKSEASKLRID